jgi:hypothetical protein
MPNTFAQLVLASWPLVALVAFGAMPPARAAAVALIAGYLLLPERAGWDFPLIPAIDKTMMINLAAAVVAYAALRREARERIVAPRGSFSDLGNPRPVDKSLSEKSVDHAAKINTKGIGFIIIVFMLTLSVVVPFVTVMTNGDPFVVGSRYLRGMAPYDAVSLMVSAAIALVPFVLGMRLFGSTAAHTELLRVLALSALAYSLLVLFEVRMSPQLSRWTYGFFPHSWIQHFRGGGFRPVVFLHHGLWLGILLSMSTLAICALCRQGLRDRVLAAPWLAGFAWMAVTLVLSRNLGATVLMVLFAPVILFTPVRVQLAAAAAVSVFVLTFPMLRGAGWFPTDVIHTVASVVDEERASSLAFRFDNEDLLLERANRRPIAGWGTWGRNRVYSEETGNDLSITDGLWVITIGMFGWVGYIAQFSLLAVPSILLLMRRGIVHPVTSGLAIVCSAAIIDLIPNATLTPVTWLFAGALAGYAIRRPGVALASQAGSVGASQPAWPMDHPAWSATPLGTNAHGLPRTEVGTRPTLHRRTRRV